MTEKYQSVNRAWPEGTHEGRDLKPTPQEALRGARRLYRFALKRPFRGKVKLTSGRNHTWVRHGVLYVNPDEGAGPPRCFINGVPQPRGGGWHEIVHSLSHYCAYRLFPGTKPHDTRHAFLEKELINYAIRSGFLEGKLKRPEKPKAVVDLRTVRCERLLKRKKAWEAKKRRAEKALKKLTRQLRRYTDLAAAA